MVQIIFVSYPTLLDDILFIFFVLLFFCFHRDCDRLTVLNHVRAHYRRGEFSGPENSKQKTSDVTQNQKNVRTQCASPYCILNLSREKNNRFNFYILASKYLKFWHIIGMGNISFDIYRNIEFWNLSLNYVHWQISGILMFIKITEKRGLIFRIFNNTTESM